MYEHEPEEEPAPALGDHEALMGREGRPPEPPPGSDRFHVSVCVGLCLHLLPHHLLMIRMIRMRPCLLHLLLMSRMRPCRPHLLLMIRMRLCRPHHLPMI